MIEIGAVTVRFKSRRLQSIYCGNRFAAKNEFTNSAHTGHFVPQRKKLVLQRITLSAHLFGVFVLRSKSVLRDVEVHDPLSKVLHSVDYPEQVCIEFAFQLPP